jgi:hypothetical protein
LLAAAHDRRSGTGLRPKGRAEAAHRFGCKAGRRHAHEPQRHEPRARPGGGMATAIALPVAPIGKLQRFHADAFDVIN